ncbi:hypothetical protein HID58_059519 [Brassica napus]|uniref:Uncharacterized protein n=1 Tax=Brassica napus TaxID=3708 RepID=A0ABQ7ZTG7_BRANA|nr:hypothetical protein HID58_059519 [Brassica napus]
MATKPNGKSHVSSDYDEKVMFFRDVSLGPHETQLRFCLIHYWEAWNPLKKTLIGLEMFLIDEQGTVIQGFISPGRIEKYLPKMKRGSVYKLNNFYGSRNKSVFRVADQTATVSFSWNSELSVLQDSPTPLMKTVSGFIRMRIFKLTVISKETSTASSITYFGVILVTLLMNNGIDVVGHMKLVNGQSLIETPSLMNGPVMKLYLWDQAARDFCKKFKSYENTPTVLLVTTVNTESLGALTSMSSSRVFMDYDVQPTIDYFAWLGSNPKIAGKVNAEVVTKREPLAIGEIFSYIKQESAKCTATIDDVVPGSAWYRAQISVYDNSEQAVFVLLGDAGRALAGKHASELVSSYFEANGNQGVNHEVSVPEALISTIRQRHKFCVKATEHNLSGKTRSLTVTKILSLDTPPATEALAGNHIAATSEETFQTGNDV